MEISTSAGIVAALLKKRWKLKPDAMGAQQAAQMLGYTTTTVAKWVKAGKLKAVPYQRSCIIPKIWLIGYLADTVNDSRATKSEKHMCLIKKCQKG